MSITRLSFNKLWMNFKRPEIDIILGARQVGKSTLLRMLEAKAKEEGYTTVFYDLEQPADLKQLSGSDEHVIPVLANAARVVFIDEFHYLKNASKIFKAIFDLRKKVKIYASGSSSLEIHKHLKESLAGRYIKTMIYPLSIEEWGKLKDFTESDYLQWGGLPGLVHRHTEGERLDLLDNILSTYITKDIKGLIREENIREGELVKIEVEKLKKSFLGALKGIGSFKKEDELDTHD